MLKGEEDFLEENEEGSLFETENSLIKEPLPVVYNAEDSHRDVRLHRRRRVPPLHLQPLAASARILRRLPDRPHRHADQADHRLLQRQSGPWSTRHEQAVADGVNVGYDVYRIETQITEAGAKLVGEPGYSCRIGTAAPRARSIENSTTT